MPISALSLSRCCSRIVTKPNEEEGEQNKVEDAIDGICLRCSSSFPIRTTSAQSFWSKFPEDITIEILGRLLETDLIASKLVSKDWNFVISRVCLPRLCPPDVSAPFCGVFCFEDPPIPEGGDDLDPDPDPDPNADKYLKLKFVGVSAYMNRVFNRQKKPGEATFIDHVMDLLPSPEHDPSDIQDCCNGVFLLASDSQYYVGNPTTKQRIPISVNPSIHNCRDTHSSLVFDPSISLNFKIVSFIRPAVNATISDPMGLDIFSSETGEWSCHILSLKPHSLYGFEWIRRAVYFNGALYYLSLAMYLVCIENIVPNSSIGHSRSSMERSDLKTWALELPDKDKTPAEPDPQHFGCIGNSLGCFYYSNRDANGSCMSVWMLVHKGKNCDWVLKHSISITQDIRHKPFFYERVEKNKMLNTFRPRALCDDQIFMATPGILVSYCLKAKAVRVCHIPWRYNRETIQLDQNWIFPFSRCLLQLNTTGNLRN